MAIRAVVFDIGGVLEVSPEGVEPSGAFPQLIARWEQRLGRQPGELAEQIAAMDARLRDQGKDGALGTITEEEWWADFRLATRMDQPQLDAFMRDFWDVYMGTLNAELAGYFRNLRPRYKTALLSNSFVGARREEQQRFHFDEMSDLIIYSHEVGLAKPDRRIFELTCERLGVRPEEVVFLDDWEPGVLAARELGIHAIVYQNPAQAIADIEACLRASETAEG